MVLTLSSLLCVCRAKLLSAEWFHNSFFQFSLAYDCLELFHTVHVVVCYVVQSFHPQMACATRLSPNARFATCEYFDENAFVIKNNNNVKHWQ